MINGNGDVKTGGSIKDLVASSALDYNHPLFFSPSDVSGIHIISFQLIGVENFSIWFWFIRIAQLERNKLGLVDSSCTKVLFFLFGQSLGEGECCCAIGIMNSFSKEFLGGIMYASIASVL